MKTKFYIALILMQLIIFTRSAFANYQPPWGFFAHKLINRLAVFTLPQEMAGFYKENISYITEHSVDPDKRRYSSKNEAPRHYIDLDVYGSAPFDALPRNWLDALLSYTDIYTVGMNGDTSLYVDHNLFKLQKNEAVFYLGDRSNQKTDTLIISKKIYADFYLKNILPKHYEDDQKISVDSLKIIFPTVGRIKSAFAKERLSENGILPYHLQQMENRLTNAFKIRDKKKVLQLSSEIGHYIGDAHVPLHTSQNYNGQLSGQHGIHGFWESRLPELLSSEYDFWVGAAEYLSDSESTYWQIVTDSHALVDTLLYLEKNLRISFPTDHISCLEERMGATVMTTCEEFARAYHESLDGQVESRMRAAILCTGSVWMTAWVKAGQPDLDFSEKDDKATEKQEAEILPETVHNQQMLGRPEE